MSERLYDRLANVFMLIAVGSALLFDSAGAWHVADGAVGIAAGVSAAVLYFRNQSRGAAKLRTTQVTDETPFIASRYIALRENWAAAVGAEWEKYAIDAYRREALKGGHLYARHRPIVQRARNRHAACWYVYEDRVEAAQQELVLSPNDVAACAIEIIRNLSSGDDCDRWQFSFGPEGLRVSARNMQDLPEPPQKDLDFGQTSTMVN